MIYQTWVGFTTSQGILVQDEDHTTPTATTSAKYIYDKCNYTGTGRANDTNQTGQSCMQYETESMISTIHCNEVT
jgi:hypothetical protein